MTTKVLVSGSGKMGREVLHAVSAETDMEPVGVVDALSAEEYISLPGGEALIPFDRDPAARFSRNLHEIKGVREVKKPVFIFTVLRNS